MINPPSTHIWYSSNWINSPQWELRRRKQGWEEAGRRRRVEEEAGELMLSIFHFFKLTFKSKFHLTAERLMLSSFPLQWCCWQIVIYLPRPTEIMLLSHCDIYLDRQRRWWGWQGRTMACRRAGPIQSWADTCLMAHYIWRITYDTWHMTHDTWHTTHAWWTLQISTPGLIDWP